MPKLLLIRHCQSIGTHPDVPLSEAGAKAAEALITRRSRPACRFAEPDYRAPGGESLNQTMQRAIATLTDIAAAGPAAAGGRQSSKLDRFRTTIDGSGVWFRAMARLADPRPVRSRSRRRSADQFRATGRPI